MRRLLAGHAGRKVQFTGGGIVVGPDDVHIQAAVGCSEFAVALPIDLLPGVLANLRVEADCAARQNQGLAVGQGIGALVLLELLR